MEEKFLSYSLLFSSYSIKWFFLFHFSSWFLTNQDVVKYLFHNCLVYVLQCLFKISNADMVGTVGMVVNFIGCKFQEETTWKNYILTNCLEQPKNSVNKDFLSPCNPPSLEQDYIDKTSII